MNKLYILLFIASCTAMATTAEHKINKLLQSEEKINAFSKGPAKNGIWTVEPNIFVCKHAPVSEYRLEQSSFGKT